MTSLGSEMHNCFKVTHWSKLVQTIFLVKECYEHATASDHTRKKVRELDVKTLENLKQLPQTYSFRRPHNTSHIWI